MMKSYHLFLSAIVLFCSSCAEHRDIYSEAPDTLAEEAKPTFLFAKFLRENDRTAFSQVLTRSSLESLKREEEQNPNYFQHLRSQESAARLLRYYSLAQWRSLRPENSEDLKSEESRLAEDQAIVVACTLENPPRGHGPVMVQFEDGAWKVAFKFRRI